MGAAFDFSSVIIKNILKCTSNLNFKESFLFACDYLQLRGHFVRAYHAALPNLSLDASLFTSQIIFASDLDFS